ncbi:MAG: hypothetical protein QM831_19190 [Kofleriaceae bacterium]
MHHKPAHRSRIRSLAVGAGIAIATVLGAATIVSAANASVEREPSILHPRLHVLAHRHIASTHVAPHAPVMIMADESSVVAARRS